MGNVKDRLIQFIEYKGLSKNKFETICGLSTRYVSNISVSIQPDKLKMISLKFPELDTGWLLTGKGDMLNSSLTAHQTVENLADRLSEVIIDINDNLSDIAVSFGITASELADFTNNLVLPPTPIDFVQFLREYPEYNYKWILAGFDPKFNADEGKCLEAIHQRVYQKNHPELFPDAAMPKAEKQSNEQHLWQQIAFQNNQLKEKDEQIRQLLDLLKNR